MSKPSTHELLRHANSKITLDGYTQAVNSNKRAAQSKAVKVMVPDLGEMKDEQHSQNGWKNSYHTHVEPRFRCHYRMRRRATRDPSGGRSVMSVPIGTKGRRLAAYSLSELPNHACIVERLASTGAAGRVKWKVAPRSPQLSLAQIRPPCHSTMDLLMARPMPLP
jgi:hypothetical protein